MSHTWSILGDTVNDQNYALYYRGQRIKEAYYRGQCVWRKDNASAKFGEVIFWDWTGRKLYTISATELLKATAFPSGIHPDSSWEQDKYPSAMEAWLHWGLEDDGWTYTLEQAKEYLRKVGYLDIAAVYKTPDNGAATIFWVNASVGQTCVLSSFEYIRGTIDWGDGTVQTGTFDEPQHTYSEAAAYRIVIHSTDELWFGRVTLTSRNTYQYRTQGVFDGGSFGYRYSEGYIYISPSSTPTQAEVAAHDSPRSTDIQPIAIYSGNNAYYWMISFYESDIQCVGMVRGHDPFTGGRAGMPYNMAYHDGSFENCRYLHTITMSPGCNSFPFFLGDSGVYSDGYEQMVERLSTIYTVANQYYYNVPFAVSTAVSAPRLKHIFLPPGYTGKTQGSPAGYGYYLKYGIDALNNADEDSEPTGISYPMTTTHLICLKNYGYQDRIVIPTDTINTTYLGNTFYQSALKPDSKFYVPNGRASYYASVLPNGSNLLAQGRIVEASTPE